MSPPIIILVRHTRVAVAPDTIYGQTDVALADSFETEAAEVLSRIKYLLNQQASVTAHSPDAIQLHSSPLTRCARLAQFIQAALAESPPSLETSLPPIQFDERLREMNFGDWENLTWSAIAEAGGRDWGENWQTQATPNGEGFPHLYERAVAFLEALNGISARQGSLHIVVTHSGVIRCLNTHARGLPKQEAFSLSPHYGAVLLLQPPRV